MVSRDGGKMRKVVIAVMALMGLVFGGVALTYLHGVWLGIAKHTPRCAPITSQTVLIVFTFTGLGLAVSLTALVASRKVGDLLVVAILAVVLNGVSFFTWAYWNTTGMLLPYEEFVKKAFGM